METVRPAIPCRIYVWPASRERLPTPGLWEAGLAQAAYKNATGSRWHKPKHFSNPLRDSSIYIISCIQGRSEGGKGGTIPRAPNHYGGAEPLRGRRKVPAMSRVFSSSEFASEKPQVLTWGRQTCFFLRAPSSLFAPLVAYDNQLLKNWTRSTS